MLGDARKAKKELNWRPKYNIKSLVKEMVNAELKEFIKVINLKSKIYVAGHNGLVGSADCTKIKAKRL